MNYIKLWLLQNGSGYFGEAFKDKSYQIRHYMYGYDVKMLNSGDETIRFSSLVLMMLKECPATVVICHRLS